MALSVLLPKVDFLTSLKSKTLGAEAQSCSDLVGHGFYTLILKREIDLQKEPKSRLSCFCLILRRLLSLKLYQEPFIGAVCKHASWERLTWSQHENRSLLQTLPYQKLPNNLWMQKIKAETEKLYSVHIFCNRTLRSSQESQSVYQTPSFSLVSQAGFLLCIVEGFFFLRRLPLSRHIVLCFSYV